MECILHMSILLEAAVKEGSNRLNLRTSHQLAHCERSRTTQVRQLIDEDDILKIRGPSMTADISENQLNS